VFKQFEILLEGMNHEAHGPLTDAELSRVRGALRAGEQLCSYVRGRVVGAGAALWVLTEQRLLFVREGRRGQVDTLPLAALQRITLQAGRYGSTVAVVTGNERRSIFAAHAGLAAAFVSAAARALPQLAIQGDTDPALDTDETADVATWVTWSRLRLQPAPHQGMADSVVMLREAATLHERGMLNDAEYGALKVRLLGLLDAA